MTQILVRNSTYYQSTYYQSYGEKAKGSANYDNTFSHFDTIQNRNEWTNTQDRHLATTYKAKCITPRTGKMIKYMEKENKLC